MRKGKKGILVTTLVCCVIGSAFCISSLCFGFRPEELRAKAEAGDLLLFGSNDWQADVRDAVTELTSQEESGDVSPEELDFDRTYSDIRKLDLEIKTGECVLIPYDGTDWRVKGYRLPSGFRSEVSGTELKIKCASSRLSIWNLNRSSQNARLEFYIPKDVVIQKLDLEVGVGDVTMQDGYLTCRKLELDNGVGASSLSVDVLDSAEISSGVGEVELNLLGTVKDFNYELEFGVGDIELDGSSRSGLGGEESIANGASKEIEIESGVGSVTVNFFEKSNEKRSGKGK